MRASSRRAEKWDVVHAFWPRPETLSRDKTTQSIAHAAARNCAWFAIMLVLSILPSNVNRAYASDPTPESFGETIQPILEQYRFTCHGNGIKKGGVDLEGIESDGEIACDRDLWRASLSNVRAGLMPPGDKPKPTAEERRLIADWIKFDAFGIDRKNPYPGRVTVRRLNRTEYRNTIRDLLDIDFDTMAEFPPDDTGHGFDNIGDVLTLSPLLLEKYLAAAEAIISKAVPTTARVVVEKTIPGRNFRPVGTEDGGKKRLRSPASRAYRIMNPQPSRLRSRRIMMAATA